MKNVTIGTETREVNKEVYKKINRRGADQLYRQFENGKYDDDDEQFFIALAILIRRGKMEEPTVEQPEPTFAEKAEAVADADAAKPETQFDDFMDCEEPMTYFEQTDRTVQKELGGQGVSYDAAGNMHLSGIYKGDTVKDTHSGQTGIVTGFSFGSKNSQLYIRIQLANGRTVTKRDYACQVLTTVNV